MLLVLLTPVPVCAEVQSAGPEEVYFATFRPANWDVYLFEEPDTPPRPLTSDPGLDYDPALSPDGRFVVFTSERRGDPDLFVLDLEGRGPPRLLIESSAMEDQAAFSPDGQTLFFVSSHGGNADVYSIPFLPDRVQSITGAVNLSRHPAGDFRPAISPDGTLIAFSSDREHASDNANPIARIRGGDLYVMSLDGGELRRVTTTPGWAGSPAWSPSGREIYHYRRSLEGGIPRYGLWAVDTDGTDQRLIYEDSLAVLSPVAFPAGDRIAFARGPAAQGTRGGITSWEIWSVPTDGGEPARVGGGARGLLGPAFGGASEMLVAFGGGPVQSDRPQSGAARALGEGPLLAANAPWFRELPDRTVSMFPIRELFVAAHPTADAVLRTVPPGPVLTVSHPDGTDAREVIDLGGGFPANGVTASPDGEWFVYMQGQMFGDPNTEADLWKVRPDGSDAVNLTPNSPGNDGFASFGPDGCWLAFRSGRDGNFEIYRMDADGGAPVNLTQHPARDAFPAVSPQGDRIAFLSDRDSDVPRLYDLYVMDLDAQGEAGAIKRVTDNEVQEGHPYFSPDGEWVVFTSEMGGLNDEEPVVQSLLFAPQMYGELYAVRLADGFLIRLTHDKWEDGFPTWVPAASERASFATPFAGAQSAGATPPPPLALTGVHVVDVRNGDILPAQTIVVRDTHIESVGPASEVSVPPDAQVVDAAGAYVIPGLWDMHVHIGYGDALVRNVFFPMFVAHGVTGVREMSGDSALLRLRSEVEQGAATGPRLVVGGLVDAPFRSEGMPFVPAWTREEGAAAVDSLAARGFDFVKTYSFVSSEAYRGIQERAQELDMEVSGHIPIAVELEDALSLGHGTIEHLAGIEFACSAREDELRERYRAVLHRMMADPAVADSAMILFGRSEWEPVAAPDAAPDAAACEGLYAELVEKGASVVPTLIHQQLVSYRFETPILADPVGRALAGLLNPEVTWSFDPERRLPAVYEHRMEGGLAELRDAGVEILAGSDLPGGLPLHYELGLLVDAGLTPLEALRAATLAPARYLGLDGSLGSVAPGKAADFVLLDGNPLEDIGNTRRIRGVVLNGRWLDREALDGMIERVEAVIQSLREQAPAPSGQ